MDKSNTIFWTQKPEGLSHVGRKIFSFSFPCLKISKTKMSWIDFVVCKFCCVSWGNKNTLFMGIYREMENFHYLHQSKVYSTKRPLKLIPWLLNGCLSEVYSFQDLVFIETFLRRKSDIITTRVILLRFRVRAYMW